MTHPHPKRNFVPSAVLMKSGLKTLNTPRQNSSRAAVSVNTARTFNTAYPKPTANCARPASNVFNRSMIGSLMYLTASRPDIMFVVCACTRFQVTPKVSHLHVVKRIFKYLKVQPKLGLWYPKDSSFDLKAYTDSDYAGASLDKKSTIGGCQFLGRRLISWQCKKQTIVANSTPEAEYVAASNETVIKEWEDRMERAFTTASSLELEKDSGNINRTQSMATLNESFPQGTDSGSGPRCQDTILGGAEAQIRFEAASKQSSDPPLSRVNTLRSGEDNMKLKELMEFCTKRSVRALDL
ncbi:hypothetical protein Tco_0455993 [Tanacetum coccineum]